MSVDVLARRLEALAETLEGDDFAWLDLDRQDAARLICEAQEALQTFDSTREVVSERQI